MAELEVIYKTLGFVGAIPYRLSFFFFWLLPSQKQLICLYFIPSLGFSSATPTFCFFRLSLPPWIFSAVWTFPPGRQLHLQHLCPVYPLSLLCTCPNQRCLSNSVSMYSFLVLTACPPVFLSFLVSKLTASHTSTCSTLPSLSSLPLLCIVCCFGW